MTSIKPVRISGTLYWTKWMSEYNTHFDEDNTKYECTIGDISDTDAEKLKELGIKIKSKEGQGSYIVGKSKFTHDPVDEDGVKIPHSEVGMGTKVFAVVSSYPHKMSKMHGNAPSIKTIIVTELKTPVQTLAEEEDEFIL